jgi:SAM-dependent methyltransferase
LRPGGRVRVNGGGGGRVVWTGEGYRITAPFCERVERRDGGGIEFRHYLGERLGGLMAAGLTIARVLEPPVESPDPYPPGSWRHRCRFLGGAFIVVATKGKVDLPCRPTIRWDAAAHIAEAAAGNEAKWDAEVQAGCGYTVPWLDLDTDVLRRFAAGEDVAMPRDADTMWPDPKLLLGEVAGKDVLCLGAGGGQQSAVYALLGARVTVADICEGQLAADRAAAERYGYSVRTVHADMQDVSALADDSFDVVYLTGQGYVPDLAAVYGEVTRVLRSGGILETGLTDPVNFRIEFDGEGYCIALPYCERVNRLADGGFEYRHYLHEQINGLLDVGFVIDTIRDDVREPPPDAPVGSWTHERDYVGRGPLLVATLGR